MHDPSSLSDAPSVYAAGDMTITPRARNHIGDMRQLGGESNDKDTCYTYAGGTDLAGDDNRRLRYDDRCCGGRREWCRHWRRDGERQERGSHRYGCRRRSGSNLRRHPLRTSTSTLLPIRERILSKERTSVPVWVALRYFR